tara:strand:- start:426 stop:665 length:240 start_codon:yes stop_codon:yes gene_type:complete
MEQEAKKAKVTLLDLENSKKEADKLMINKIVKYENKITTLKKEIKRLNKIENSHQKLNGKLRVEIRKLKKEAKELLLYP